MVKRAFVSSLVVAVAILSVAAACGGGSDDPTTPPGTVASTSIGPTGGTVQGSGVTLRIPDGAVAQTVTISITAAPDAVVPDGYVATTPVYEFLPDGLVFTKPATIEITRGADDGDGTPSTIVWSTTAGGVQDLASTVSGNVMTASVQHFSHGFIGHHRTAVISASDAAGAPDTSSSPTDAGRDAIADAPSTCNSNGGSCDAGSQCCSGSCNGGSCGDAGACLGLQQRCTAPSQCCSGNCLNLTCFPPGG